MCIKPCTYITFSNKPNDQFHNQGVNLTLSIDELTLMIYYYHIKIC